MNVWIYKSCVYSKAVFYPEEKTMTMESLAYKDSNSCHAVFFLGISATGTGVRFPWLAPRCEKSHDVSMP